MDKATRNKIRRQFSELANHPLGDDAAAAKMLTETAAALISFAADMNVPFDAMEQETRDDWNDACESVLSSVEAISDRMPHKDERKALELVRSENRELLSQSGQVREYLREQTQENENLSAELNRIKLEYSEACSSYRRMKAELDKIFPDAYNKQVADNQRTKQELDEKRRLMEEALSERDVLAQEHQEAASQLERLNREIDTIPRETVQFVETFARQEALLKRLREAEKNFTPEIKQELENKIAALEADLAGLNTQKDALEQEHRQAKDALKAARQKMEQSRTEYDEERQRLTSDLPANIIASLDELDEQLGLHAEILAQTRTRAEALKKKLAECERQRDEFSGDWDGVQSVLDVMAQILEKQDPLDAKLRDTLNPEQLNRMKTLYRDVETGLHSVETGLDELKGLLRRCYAARTVDSTDIGTRVQGGAGR